MTEGRFGKNREERNKKMSKRMWGKSRRDIEKTIKKKKE